MLLAGMAIILVGSVYPEVTVIITEPKTPIIHDTMPANGATYEKITVITAVVSYADSVTCVIDGTTYYLTKSDIQPLQTIQPQEYVIWDAYVNIDEEGTYNFMFTATNEFGAVTSSGSFKIYQELTGTWYINDVQITSSDQVVEFETTTLTFKFVPTKGTPTSCTVTYSGPESGSFSLTKQDAQWLGTKTFKPGTYQMDLAASDGTTIVRMTITAASMGQLPIQWLNISLLSMMGFTSMAIGLLLILFGKR